jgi:hypothetical protein
MVRTKRSARPILLPYPIKASRQCGFGLGDQTMKNCFRRLD